MENWRGRCVWGVGRLERERERETCGIYFGRVHWVRPIIMLVHPRWSYTIERLSEPCAGVYNGPPAVYRVWHQTASTQRRIFVTSHGHRLPMCMHMLCARAGTCLTALLRIETIHWEYCPISGTGQRDRYTGTLGRSRLADAGTATQGPDKRIHMRV